MAIAAKSRSGATRIDVALITKITVIVVPRPLGVEARRTGRVKAGVGPPDTVGIVMTAAPGTGGIVRIMARGAVFHIVASRSPMFGEPSQRGM